MTEQGKIQAPAQPWTFPVRVEDVPETGLPIVLTADAPTRAALAKIAGVRALPSLEADFEVVRLDDDGLHVTGEVKAVVEQTCVVTLEPIRNDVTEAIDLTFRANASLPPVASARSHGAAPDEGGGEPPEPLVNGVADLGAIATEFLLLGIDPYPRKAGVEFAPPAAPAQGAGPFAALSGLQPKRSRDEQA